MIQDWLTRKFIEKAKFTWIDGITEDEIGISDDCWREIMRKTIEDISSWPDGVTEVVTELSDYLSPLSSRKQEHGYFRVLPLSSLAGETVSDYALTCSAVSYCLAYEKSIDTEDMARLRLSALTLCWREELPDVFDMIWSKVNGISPIEPNATGGDLEKILYVANILASKRLTIRDGDWQPEGDSSGISGIESGELFDTHPISKYLPADERRIGLVLGGATKIKDYFMESARLPEIRGASTLLDRINLEDIPALFGVRIDDRKRAQRLRETFWNRSGKSLSAPECVIYAAGGSFLAFTPASVTQEIAEEIERIYTQETLVANSVAVGDNFDLLELQYGLKPKDFWLDGFNSAMSSKEAKIRQLLISRYGQCKLDFLRSKCFGEVTSKLASMQYYRREGNSTPGRSRKHAFPPVFEVDPFQTLCSSCNRRPVLMTIESIDGMRTLCEACARKYVTGRAAKKKVSSWELKPYIEKLEWSPSDELLDKSQRVKDWITRFESYLVETGRLSEYLGARIELDNIDAPQNLADIGDASDPKGFIGVIYADGNNMGGYLENMSAPAQYRRFSERVSEALQSAAFDALAKNVKPREKDGKAMHEFEIISIGGDDLLLIVPGDKAIQVAIDIGLLFEKRFLSSKLFPEDLDQIKRLQRYDPDGWIKLYGEMLPAISLSSGVIIADQHTPFDFLESLSMALLKSAKEKSKSLVGEMKYSIGTLDFLALKSLSMIDSNIRNYRQNLVRGTGNSRYSLTMRPFTLFEAVGLVESIKEFKAARFPRSQLYQLRRSFERGALSSAIDYMYFVSRLQDEKHRVKIREVLEKRWTGLSVMPPWYERGENNYETLIADIMEIFDFIGDTKNGGRHDNEK